MICVTGLERRGASRAWLAAPAAAAFLVYAGTLRAGLVWDDVLLIPDLVQRVRVEGWVRAVASPIFSQNYFRPAAGTLLAEELFGDDARALVHHAVAVALHALDAFLVAVLAGRLVPTNAPARRFTQVVSGVAFAVHPACVEAVAFVSGRFDLLMTACLLGALAADAFIARPASRAAAVGALFFAAALSKEMAAGFVLALPLWHRAREGASARATLRRHAATYAAVALAGGVYVALRAAALGRVLPAPTAAQLDPGSAGAHVLLVGKTLATFARLAIFPFGAITPVHVTALPVGPEDLAAWCGLALAVVGIAVLVGRMRSGAGRGPAPLVLAAALVLLPVLNLRPMEFTPGIFTAERFLLLPIALLAISCGAVLPRLLASRAGAFAAAAWIGAAAWTTVLTTAHWHDDLSLWTWAARVSPDSVLAQSNLSFERMQVGDVAGAEDAARRAVALPWRYAYAHPNLGVALAHRSNFEGALAAFERAVEIDPSSVASWENLARALLALGRAAEALRAVEERALPRGVRSAELAMLRSQALVATGDAARAEEVLVDAAAEHPRSAEVQRELGVLARARADRETAARRFRRALELAPDWALARRDLESVQQRGAPQ